MTIGQLFMALFSVGAWALGLWAHVRLNQQGPPTCGATGPYTDMPCVKTRGHKGTMHRNARGWTWTGDAPGA